MEQDSSFTAEPQLGRILIESGVATEEQMREVILLQREMERAGRSPLPRLGELLVERGYATAEQVRDALAAQNRRILYCPKCALPMNVDLRPDVTVYRCGRCETPLIEPPATNEIKAMESTLMLVLRDPLPAEVQARLQDPQAKFGKYIVVGELGRGGVGVVYKAWDTYLGQFVALKRLKSLAAQGKETAREGHVASLLKEARSAVRLRHPHIATVYDVGRVGREFYMSMEFLEGRTLGQHIKDARGKGAVSPFYGAWKRYLRIIRDVARAVHYAHTRPSPVIHCDLKPSNVFIDTGERAYVLDFGLARHLHRFGDDAGAGAVSGTPSYMAPEQASGHTEDIDPRTDVYGLGAILYELLTGRPPFRGSVLSVLRKSLSELPERPGDVLTVSAHDKERATLPAGLEDLCLRCLEKDRAMRFPSAHAVADAIERIIKGDTHIAQPSPGAFTPSPRLAPPLPPPSPAVPPAPVAAVQPPTRRAFMFAAGALVCAAGFGAIAVAWQRRDRDPYGQPRRTATASQMVAQAAAFRPDLALADCRAAVVAAATPAERADLERLLDELRWMDLARGRVLDAIDAARPRLAELRLRSGRIAGVEVLKAAPHALVVYASERTQEIAWGDLDPAQLFDLAEPAARTMLPPERLGLALWARRAGLAPRARPLLDSLAGTELEPAAAAYRD